MKSSDLNKKLDHGKIWKISLFFFFIVRMNNTLANMFTKTSCHVKKHNEKIKEYAWNR